MNEHVRIQMMGSFLIYIGENRVEDPVSRSHKGAALMAFLILHRGQRVPNQLLIRSLWPGGSATNPANALKTLISRMRSILNEMVEGLGDCIASDRGAYHWQAMPELSIDVLEIMDIFAALARTPARAAAKELYRRLSLLYRGDLFQTGDLEEEAAYAEQLHSQYLSAMYTYIDILRENEEYNEISEVCRRALKVDNFDDRLHIEMMRAMVNLNRAGEALVQYRHATDMASRYLDVEPSEEMKAFYWQMNRSHKQLSFNLDAFRNELQEDESERGAFVCDYAIFRAIYNLHMRNLERTGATGMFLAAFMIGSAEDPEADRARNAEITASLVEILRDNLRRGDIITLFSPTIILLLLPFPDQETGNMVVERIHQLYARRYADASVSIHHRLGRLGRGGEEEAETVEIWR